MAHDPECNDRGCDDPRPHHTALQVDGPGRCESTYPATYETGAPVRCDLFRGHLGEHGDAFAARYWRDEPVKRGRARVCGDCWAILRPDEYEPMGGAANPDACSLCGALWSGLHRVAWAEVDSARPMVDEYRA